MYTYTMCITSKWIKIKLRYCRLNKIERQKTVTKLQIHLNLILEMYCVYITLKERNLLCLYNELSK